MSVIEGNAIAGLGITATIPDGWSARIFLGGLGGANLQAANFDLPVQLSSFGADITDQMPAGGFFFTMVEYENAFANVGLYSTEGVPGPFAPSDASPNTLLNALPDQAGIQRFFSVADRAFCVFMVFSTAAGLPDLVDAANALLASIEVEPGIYIDTDHIAATSPIPDE